MCTCVGHNSVCRPYLYRPYPHRPYPYRSYLSLYASQPRTGILLNAHSYGCSGIRLKICSYGLYSYGCGGVRLKVCSYGLYSYGAAGSGSRYVVMAYVVMAAAGSCSRPIVMAYLVMAYLRLHRPLATGLCSSTRTRIHMYPAH